MRPIKPADALPATAAPQPARRKDGRRYTNAALREQQQELILLRYLKRLGGLLRILPHRKGCDNITPHASDALVKLVNEYNDRIDELGFAPKHDKETYDAYLGYAYNTVGLALERYYGQTGAEPAETEKPFVRAPQPEPASAEPEPAMPAEKPKAAVRKGMPHKRLEDVALYIIDCGTVEESKVARQFGFGPSQAAYVFDVLEGACIIGPADAYKRRQALVRTVDELSAILDDLYGPKTV